jgi:hypothetical protein
MVPVLPLRARLRVKGTGSAYAKGMARCYHPYQSTGEFARSDLNNSPRPEGTMGHMIWDTLRTKHVPRQASRGREVVIAASGSAAPTPTPGLACEFSPVQVASCAPRMQTPKLRPRVTVATRLLRLCETNVGVLELKPTRYDSLDERLFKRPASPSLSCTARLRCPKFRVGAAGGTPWVTQSISAGLAN